MRNHCIGTSLSVYISKYKDAHFECEVNCDHFVVHLDHQKHWCQYLLKRLHHTHIRWLRTEQNTFRGRWKSPPWVGTWNDVWVTFHYHLQPYKFKMPFAKLTSFNFLNILLQYYSDDDQSLQLVWLKCALSDTSNIYQTNIRSTRWKRTNRKGRTEWDDLTMNVTWGEVWRLWETAHRGTTVWSLLSTAEFSQLFCLYDTGICYTRTFSEITVQIGIETVWLTRQEHEIR